MLVGGTTLSFPYINSKYYNTNLAPSFYVGGVARIKLNKVLFIEPGLNFNIKRYVFRLPQYMYTAKVKYNPICAEVPVNLTIMLRADKESSFLFNAGPYFAVGFAGKRKEIATQTVSGQQVTVLLKEDLNWGNDRAFDALKPLDFGVQAGVSYQYKRVLFSVNYQQGLTNLQPGAKEGEKYKNRVARIGMGYLF